MKKYNLKKKGMAAAALTLAFGMLAPSISFAAGTPVSLLAGTERIIKKLYCKLDCYL